MQYTYVYNEKHISDELEVLCSIILFVSYSPPRPKFMPLFQPPSSVFCILNLGNIHNVIIVIVRVEYGLRLWLFVAFLLAFGLYINICFTHGISNHNPLSLVQLYIMYAMSGNALWRSHLLQWNKLALGLLVTNTDTVNMQLIILDHTSLAQWCMCKFLCIDTDLCTTHKENSQ